MFLVRVRAIPDYHPDWVFTSRNYPGALGGPVWCPRRPHAAWASHMAKGNYTRAANDEKFAEKQYMLLQLQLAKEYALRHGLGAKATVATKLFPGITRNILQPALSGKCLRAAGERHARDVLTQIESQQLCDWIVARPNTQFP